RPPVPVEEQAARQESRGNQQDAVQIGQRQPQVGAPLEDQRVARVVDPDPVRQAGEEGGGADLFHTPAVCLQRVGQPGCRCSELGRRRLPADQQVIGQLRVVVTQARQQDRRRLRLVVQGQGQGEEVG